MPKRPKVNQNPKNENNKPNNTPKPDPDHISRTNKGYKGNKEYKSQ